ncbi:MAG: esterase family protein [Bacteroidales bacterium]|nr:esterase family protein [Bacteroidales bacterium]MBP5675511.1 esterase family protein [Bacteroidales bacterium]
MKRIIVIVALMAAAVAAAAQGRIVTESIHSGKLGADQNYNVYLPEGFNPFKQHYPVIYLLHGLTDDYTAWDKLGRISEVADELIRSGELRPVVIVMPNAGNKDIHNYQNGYFNVPEWPYEDFFFKELLPAVEKKYNCGGSKGARAVMGLSMGGGGSIVYCQRHPDMFSSCYAMSPWLDNKKSEVNDGKQEKVTKFTYTQQAVSEHSAIDFLSKAGEATIENLQTVKWFIDCGDDDFIFDLSTAFYAKMRQRGVKAEFRVRDGVHNWEYWHISLRTALPFASRNFSL